MIPSAATAGRNSGQGRNHVILILGARHTQGTMSAFGRFMAAIGGKRTWREGYVMSAYDPKRTKP
jgi:hypothetical protein